ncbi:GNAT family N-acetyltransferase [Streptomyces sp. NPDC051018]|uniref:GNAT family N-acetyltransferase n=1 Tax=Streptomyces sp. NPDC051018 TaxID=3365639 RepID=UPI00378F9C31
MTVLLTTARLTLRALDEADLDQLFALENDPEVMRFLNGGRPTTRRAVRAESLPRLLRHHACIGRPGHWAAEERETGAFLGWFEFRPLEDDRADVVELGYRLGRAFWGRGYATEGARGLIRAGFTELCVRRVVAKTMAVNTRSRRVMEKAGMRYVRTFFEDWPDSIDGSESGDVEYALAEKDWRRLSGTV